MTVATETVTSDRVRRALEGRRLNLVDASIAFVLLLSLFVSLGVLATLLTDVARKAWPALSTRGMDLVVSPLSPDATQAGLIQGIFGSVVLTAFVVVVSFPLGVAAAVYLEEYAEDTRLTRMIVTNIRNLAGVPSIVYGILGFFLFVKLLPGLTNGRTLVTGGLTLAILVLPIIVITASEALRAVPQAIREASFGVGATRWETIRHHVLPVAAPGVLTGSVLAIARAFGESAPLLLAGAVLSNFFSAPAGTSLWGLVTEQNYTALPIVVFNWARQPQKEFVELTAAAIVVLLVVLLAVNAVAILARDRIEARRAR